MTNPVKAIIQDVTIKGTHGEWRQVILTLIQKAGGAKEIKNYRPNTLLNSIYKIWTAIMHNRLKPIMNIRTKETQHGYKIKKSTVDIVYR